MNSKGLSKSTAEKLKKFLDRERIVDKIVDKFEKLIEDTWLDKPYYYCYRKFKWGWWNPRTAYYKVKYGVQNLVRWFPLIWNDRDWDWRYWLEMNHKKLSSMEYNIRNNGNHVHCERDADNIHKAVLAIERLLADEYHENAFKNHDKKYGDINIDWKPAENNCSEAIITRKKTKTERDIHYEYKASRRLYKHEQYLQQQDLEYATKIINKYLFHWWD